MMSFQFTIITILSFLLPTLPGSYFLVPWAQPFFISCWVSFCWYSIISYVYLKFHMNIYFQFFWSFFYQGNCFPHAFMLSYHFLQVAVSSCLGSPPALYSWSAWFNYCQSMWESCVVHHGLSDCTLDLWLPASTLPKWAWSLCDKYLGTAKTSHHTHTQTVTRTQLLTDP